MPSRTLLTVAALLLSSAAAARGLPQVDPTVERASDCAVRFVSFRDEQEGWLFTGCEDVLRTHDGGRTWQKDPALSKVLLSAATMGTSGLPEGDSGLMRISHLVWLTPRLAVAFGSGAPWEFRTEDGGKTWQRVSLPAGHSLDALDAVGERLWRCDGRSGQLFRSDDAGRSWKQLIAAPLAPVSFWDNTTAACSDLAFIDGQDGWLALTGGTLWRTADGGETWTPMRGLDLPAPKPDPTWGLRRRGVSLQRITPRLAWASVEGELYRTRDGGQTWQRHPAPRTRVFNPVTVRSGARRPWIAWAAGPGIAPEQLEPTMRGDTSPWGEHGVVAVNDLDQLTFYREGKRLRAGLPLTRGTGPLVTLEGRVRGTTQSWGWVGARVLTTLDGANWFRVGALPVPVRRLVARDTGILLAQSTGGDLFYSDDLGSTWARTRSPLDAADFAQASGASPPPGTPPECVLTSDSAMLQAHIAGRGHNGGNGWKSLLTLRVEGDRIQLEAEDSTGEARRAIIGRAQARQVVRTLLAAARRPSSGDGCALGTTDSATLSWSCGTTKREPLKHETDHCGGAGGLFYVSKIPGFEAPDPRTEGIPQAARRLSLELLQKP